MASTNSKERAARLISLVRDNPDLAVDALTSALTDPTPLVRHVAAVKLSQLMPASVPSSTIHELAAFLAETYNNREAYGSFPIVNDYIDLTEGADLQQDTVMSFANLNCGQADFLIQPLIGYLSCDEQFYELGHAMLALAFPRARRPPNADTFNNAQKSVLQSLISSDQIWSGDRNFAEALNARGLPTTQDELKQLLTAADSAI